MIYSRDLRSSKCYSSREPTLPSGPRSVFMGVISAFLTGSGHVYKNINLFLGCFGRFPKFHISRSIKGCCRNKICVVIILFSLLLRIGALHSPSLSGEFVRNIHVIWKYFIRLSDAVYSVFKASRGQNCS